LTLAAGWKAISLFYLAAMGLKSVFLSVTETAVIRHFQERMPHGLFVPDVQ
jgi:hypothetical protein